MAFDLEAALRDPGYPGQPRSPGRPFVFYDGVRSLEPEDLERFWLLEYRWPNGITPLGLLHVEDGLQWAGQYAASRTPLPTTNGLDYRLLGTHLYSSEMPQPSQWESGFRAARLARSLPRFLESFEEHWRITAASLLDASRSLEAFDTGGKTLPELGRYLADARAFQRHAWEVHFELMYPLLVNYAGFYELCRDLRLPRELTVRFFQGHPSRVTACDEALWRLARIARDHGVEHILLSCQPDQARSKLESAGSAGRAYVAAFDAFLEEFGWRTETVADPIEPSWIEDPTVPWGTLQSFLRRDASYDFATALAVARAERDRAVDEARARLTRRERDTFDHALSACQRANFVWWNEDHNILIDMRAGIPLRRAALAIGAALDPSAPPETIFCFYHELQALAGGRLRWPDIVPVVRDRRDYYATWKTRRKDMPKYLGRPPDSISDPIMVELDGVTPEFLEAVRAGDRGARQLAGMGAAPGRARGPARVLHAADEIHGVEPGEILVCEGTSSSWTPAFTKVAGCVCDHGGMLAHASIVSREYGVPCVVGVGIATAVIQTGDTVEVDGTTGEVRVLAERPAR